MLNFMMQLPFYQHVVDTGLIAYAVAVLRALGRLLFW